jgi:hypothetical protein
VRHGTTNLLAALNVGTGEVLGECHPIRDGARTFLTFRWLAEQPARPVPLHCQGLVLETGDRAVPSVTTA